MQRNTTNVANDANISIGRAAAQRFMALFASADGASYSSGRGKVKSFHAPSVVLPARNAWKGARAHCSAPSVQRAGSQFAALTRSRFTLARIQLLGPIRKIQRLMPFLLQDTLSADPEFLISFSYRRIIREPLLSQYAGKIINLHISALPWNRGANPNYWAWRDGTPKGVTIHIVDEGLDTGPIVAQRIFYMASEDHTLQTSYDFLQDQIVLLFGAIWPSFRAGNIDQMPQSDGGSIHLEKVALPNKDMLIKDWL